MYSQSFAKVLSDTQETTHVHTHLMIHTLNISLTHAMDVPEPK